MAFSCQDYHLILDSACLPNMEMPIFPQHLGEIDCYPWFEANPKISATDARTQVTGSSTSDDCSRAPCIGRSPVLDEPQGDKIPRSQPGCAERKRKPSAAGARLITGKSQVHVHACDIWFPWTVHSSLLLPHDLLHEIGGFKKKPKVDGKKASEPPVDFIHVRARRGEATDSHSLAERVRRKKISERMDVLQGLVPGCHQMKGKALILDEIINYVRSLQNQVEFLSMKLALLSPMLHDLGYLSGQPEVGEEPFLPLILVVFFRRLYIIHYNLIPDDTRINHLVQDDSSFRIQDLEQEQRCLDEMEFDDMLLFS
ncbi:unnamed protein product, partial [Musa acuminata subsp. burmannicoides]